MARKKQKNSYQTADEWMGRQSGGSTPGSGGTQSYGGMQTADEWMGANTGSELTLKGRTALQANQLYQRLQDAAQVRARKTLAGYLGSGTSQVLGYVTDGINRGWQAGSTDRVNQAVNDYKNQAAAYGIEKENRRKLLSEQEELKKQNAYLRPNDPIKAKNDARLAEITAALEEAGTPEKPKRQYPDPREFANQAYAASLGSGENGVLYDDAAQLQQQIEKEKRYWQNAQKRYQPDSREYADAKARWEQKFREFNEQYGALGEQLPGGLMETKIQQQTAADIQASLEEAIAQRTKARDDLDIAIGYDMDVAGAQQRYDDAAKRVDELAAQLENAEYKNTAQEENPELQQKRNEVQEKWDAVNSLTMQINGASRANMGSDALAALNDKLTAAREAYRDAKAELQTMERGERLDTQDSQVRRYDTDRYRDDFEQVAENAMAASLDGPDPREPVGYYIANQEQLDLEAQGQRSGLDRLAFLADDEISEYFFRVGKYGLEDAKAYLDTLEVTLDKRKSDYYSGNQEILYGTSNALVKAGMNAASVPMNVIGGVSSAVADVGSAITGNFNPYSPGHEMSDYANTVRGVTARDITENVKDPFWQTVWQNTYYAGMSALDSALGAALFGKGYTAIMGASSASQRARELYEDGASGAQIALGALASGAIEMATEKYSIEYFTSNFLKGDIKGFADWMKKTLIQGATEMSEEVASELANQVVDALLRGANSDNNQEIQEMIAQGIPEDEAKRQALVNRAVDVFWAGYGGFVSGAAMGGVGGAIDKGIQNAQYKADGARIIQNEGIQALIDQAKGLNVNEKLLAIANDRATRTLEQLQSENLIRRGQTRKALGQLYAQVTRAQAQGLESTARADVRQAAEQALAGQVENPQAAAEAATKAAFGEALTEQEQQSVEAAGGENFVARLQDTAQNATDTWLRTVGLAAEEGNSLNPKTLAQQRGIVQEAAQEFSDPAAMVSAYRDGQDPALFIRGWKAAYANGQNGVALKYSLDSRLTSRTGMSRGQIIAAHEAGRKAAGYGSTQIQTEENTAAEGGVWQGQEWNDMRNPGRKKGAVAEGAGAGAAGGQEAGSGADGAAAGGKVSARGLGIRNGTAEENLTVRPKERYTEAEKAAAEVAAEHGLDITIVQGGSIKTVEQVDGKDVLTKSRALIVGDKMIVRSDDPLFSPAQIARHEAAHKQLENGELSLGTAVRQLQQQYSTAQIREMIRLYTAAYGNSGMNARQVLEEMVCDAMGKMNAFATEETSTVAGEVGQFLRDLRKTALETQTDGQKNSAQEGVKHSREMDGYDYTRSFEQQLEDWKDGKIPKNDTLLVGATPEVFKGIGMPALPVTINGTHIDYALNNSKDFDHFLGAALLKQLPEAIKKPVAIMTSGTKSNSSVVAMLEVRHNGKQVVVPVAVGGFGYQNGIRIDSNAITSAYGKNNSISKVLHDAIEQESSGSFRLYYLDEEKATALFQGARVPMPKMPGTHDGGFIHSLTDTASPVKLKISSVTQSQQFKRWFGDWQNDPAHASKVVNADGTPKVVYHGTNEEFTVFDLSKSGKNYGETSEGLFFFTNKKSGYQDSALDYAEAAAQSGGKATVGEYYLSIRNPLRLYSDGYYTPTAYFDQNAQDVYEKYLSGENYDGIIIENRNKSVDDSVIYLLDNPTQIKSATDNIGTFDGKNPDIRYSRELDSEYMELAKDPEGNREKISRMVAEAARAAGYDSPLLYHGTQRFGFTQFDLSKMDDGQSIFLTSNPDIASTYSGVGGKRDISNASRTDVSKLSIQEVAKMLNQFPPESGSDYSYSYVSSKADIEKQVDSGIAKLNGMIPALKSKYAEDSSEISKLNHLRNLLFLGDRSSIATALWTISRKFDIFDGNEDFINNLEQNIRLLGKAPSTGGFVVEKFLGGYSIKVLNDAEAREALQKNMQRGNYGLYAKLGNFLTVDGNGNYWNDLKNWAKAMEVDEKSTYVMEDNGWFYLLRTTDDSVVENGFVSATKQARALSQESLHSLLIQKANTSLRILAERTTTTRGVAKWAKNTGYDSVIFKDIKDSGGQNDNVGLDTTADVYVIFNPNDAKSADAVTYDDDGKVIPLSERFNSGKGDIRYSRELETVEALKRQNEILQKQRDYWKEQTRTTDEKTRGADKGEVRSLAGQLIRQYSSKTEVEEILPEMQWLADSIWRNDPKISYTDLQDSAQNIARMVLDGSEVNLNAENWETGQELKRFLRGRYINVDESLKEDIGDFKNFKRSNRSLHFRENGTGTGVNSLWLELQNDFGKGLFPDSISNPGDQIRHIADTLASLTESDMRNPYAADMELTVEQMAYDVMARAAGLNRQKATKADQAVERATEELNRLLKAGRTRERARIEQNQKTTYRQQIKNVSEKFQRMLLRPGKGATQHAPANLVGAVRSFCELFNDSEMRRAARWQLTLEERSAALAEQAARDYVPQGAAEEARKIGTSQERLDRMTARLADLQKAYSSLATGEYQNAYDDTVKGIIDSMAGALAGKDIYQLDTNDLLKVKNTMTALLHTISNANQAFSMGKDKTVSGMAQKMASEMRQVNHQMPGLRSMAGRYWMWQKTPDVFFNYMCGYIKDNEGKVVQKAFQRGSEKMFGVQREFYQMFQEYTEGSEEVQKELKRLMNDPKKNLVSWGLKDRGGNEVQTSRGMMMQAYMLLRQHDSFESLQFGGFSLPNTEEYYKGNVRGAYGNMDESEMVSEALGSGYSEIAHEQGEIREQIEELRQQMKALSPADAQAVQEQIDGLEQQRKENQKQLEDMAFAAAEKLGKLRQTIEEQLTPLEKQLIDRATEWYAHTGKLMKDVFLEMYGYAPNLVDNYVPIHRDPATIKTDIRDMAGAEKAFNLENSSFTIDRVKNYQPILLTDFFQELEGQKEKMSRYVGFAQVQKDFGKLWKTRIGSSGMTINKLVEAKFGSGRTKFGVSGTDFVEHYIADIAGGHSSEDILGDFYGHYAAATLRFNPRVAVSQAASIPTAAAVVGWKSAAVGFAKGLPNAMSTKYRNELAAQNVWFWQRYRGQGGSTELADIRQKGGVIERIANSNVGKKLFNWCQAVDVFSTGSFMWCMAEDYVQRTQGLRPGMEGYESAVNETYTDIIRKSQPNYTTTERSDLLRDKRAHMKMLTMFKTQSSQNLNLLMEANGEFMRARLDLKNGANGVTEADVKAARTKLANAATGVFLGGTVAFVGLRTIMNFIMGAVNPYRDEETDEVTPGGVIKGMSKEVLSSLAGTIALGGQVYDLVMSVVSGDKYYGMSDSALTTITELVENSQKVIANALDTDKEITPNQIWNMANSWCQALGIPASNAKKLYNMIDMYIRDIRNGTFGQYTSSYTSKDQYRARVAQGVIAGETGKADDALAMLFAQSTKDNDEDIQKDIAAGMREYLKKAYMTADVTDLEAERILEYTGTEDPAAVVARWDFMLEQPEVDNVSDNLVAAYNGRGDLDGDLVIEAYKYKGQHTKEEVVKYIQSLEITAAQKRALWDLIKGNWKGKDTPWG